MLRLRSFRLAWMLVLADLFMIVSGFVGEMYGTSMNGHWYPHRAGEVGRHSLWGVVSTLGYAVTLCLLLNESARLARTQPGALG